MMRKIRAFYALQPDNQAHKQLIAWLNTLKRSNWAGQVKWVADDNLHLTVRFLGSVTTAQLDALHDTLMTTRHSIPPAKLVLSMSHPKFFPSARNARIIACHVEPNEKLLRLVHLLETIAVEQGLAPETRTFNGHITLGRLRKSIPKQTDINIHTAPISMTATELILYKSELTPTGACYNVLRKMEI